MSAATRDLPGKLWNSSDKRSQQDYLKHHSLGEQSDHVAN